MSRIGKKPIALPAGVTATVNGSQVTVKGPKGTLTRTLHSDMRPALDGNTLSVHYQGACGSCPSSLSGTLAGIENLVKSIEPDIEVVAV